jgi:hypothetical protein
MGAFSVDRHDYVFQGKRHYVVPIRIFVWPRTSSDGPRGHEAPHHVTILELVSDGVYVVYAGFFEKPLDVVCRQPYLTLVIARGGRGCLTSEPLTSLLMSLSWSVVVAVP